MPPKVRGELSEMEAHLALMRAGYVVLTAPYTDSQRYDCVLDDGEAFRRVQVKTGRLTDDGGAIVFPTCSNNSNTGAVHGYRGAADLFAVFCPQNGKTYLVPVDHVGAREAFLRLVPGRNNQRARVRWAADYEVVASGA